MNQNAPFTLSEVLDRLVSRLVGFDISDAHEAVEAYAKAHPDNLDEEERVVKAELVAPSLFADHSRQAVPCGAHLGPMLATWIGRSPLQPTSTRTD